tara:strand:- start:241 stop:696 length:456 start_codon:yes stop_codon:yes gene_type:complete
MTNIIDKIYDNTENGIPNYSIDLIDGRRLYYRGTVMNPLPQSGDAINFTELNTKTSKTGNQYTNIKDVEVIADPSQQTGAPQPIGNVMEKLSSPQPINGGNPISKSDTQRLDIFVTGVVGRSMGSGHFSVNDIEALTKNAVIAFNENLKKL